MICWRLIQDFIANPDKYDFKKRMEAAENNTTQLNLF